MSRFDETPRADLGLAVAAGLMGAAGVGLAAIAAHRLPTPALASAAQMLMVHAVAVLAVSAWAVRSVHAAGWWRVAARVMLLGVALFAGDVALRAFEAGQLFAKAAPIGGSLTILSWLLVAVAAAVDWRRS
ncbi:MAG: DUF423 domain-containing protein [Hyphomicrobium sp.]|jgi:uncharacterized membrane protein YgdD (TMEM256/DUF423 family)|nr:DUF423 domain-containing protein [Hyphomicrobium sp.]